MEERSEGILLRLTGPAVAMRRYEIWCAGRRAEVAVDQIRTVSKVRLGDKIGSLNKREAAALRRVIKEMYAD